MRNPYHQYGDTNINYNPILPIYDTTSSDNELYLLELMMKHCGIIKEDLGSTEIVRAKVREASINFILSK